MILDFKNMSYDIGWWLKYDEVFDVDSIFWACLDWIFQIILAILILKNGQNVCLF